MDKGQGFLPQASCSASSLAASSHIEGSSLSGHCSSLPQQVRGVSHQPGPDSAGREKGKTTVNTARKPTESWDGGFPQHCFLPISGQTGLEDQDGSVPKLGQCQATFPRRPSWGTGKAKSSCSQSPSDLGMPRWTMPRLILVLNIRPCKEPQPWAPGAGSSRSSHPLICSLGNSIQAPTPTPAHLPSSLPLALRHPSGPADHASSRCKTRGWH